MLKWWFRAGFVVYSVNSITCADTVTSFLPTNGKYEPLISTVSFIIALALPSSSACFSIFTFASAINAFFDNPPIPKT